MTAGSPGIPGTPIQITPDVERAPWTDLSRDTPHGRVARIGLLRHGTTDGRASAAVVIDMDDGTRVVAETTWRLLHVAVKSLAAGPVGIEEVDD